MEINALGIIIVIIIIGAVIWAIFITISAIFESIGDWFKLKTLPPKIHNEVVSLKQQAKYSDGYFDFESSLSEVKRRIAEREKDALRQAEINLKEFKKEHKARIKKENYIRKKSSTKKQSKTKKISNEQSFNETNIKIAISELNRNEVYSLWHITHRDNIDSILKKGIMNHNDANKLKYVDISNQGVQDRRQKVESINNRAIHEYAPLFINPKNAMLYSKKNIRDELCLLEISLDVLECEYIYTDGNASRRDTNFFGRNELSFETMAWDNIFSESWTHFGERDEEIMSQMQSEFLIYPSIKSKYIKKIHCYSKESVKFFKKTNISKSILLNRQAFTFEFENTDLQW